MAFRYLRITVSLCTIIAGCAGSFICGYCAGYREALHEWYFEPAVVIRDEHTSRTNVPSHTAPTQPEFKAYKQVRR